MAILQCLWVIQRPSQDRGGLAREWWGQWRGLPPSLTRPPQVVAVVMDMFTDVDLLSEVLEAAARRVPVYILLDEMNAQHFLDMAEKCRVNLHHVDVSAWEGACREGETTAGQRPNAFLPPVPARAHCGRPHLLLPHREVFPGPREGEVPPSGLCRGDEWELQVRPAPVSRNPSASPPQGLLSRSPPPVASEPLQT